MKKISRIDCDVFCVDGTVDFDEICITGNFYADCTEIYVRSLEAGESIDICASVVSIDTLLTYGPLNLQTTYLELGTIVSGGETTVNFYPEDTFRVCD